jgi:hypothetical protein
MSVPGFAEIIPSGEMTRRDYRRVAEACTEINFAVVRGTSTNIDELAAEAADFTRAADRDEGRRYDADPVDGVFTRDFHHGELNELYPILTSNVLDMAVGIARAARGNIFRRSPKFGRVSIGPVLQSDIFIANTYPPGGVIERHFDDNNGIAIVVNAQGIGGAELTDDTGRVLGTTDLEPGDRLIMPAKVNGYGGRQHQAWHRIENKTPLSDNGGIRRSIAAVVRNSEVEEP